MGGWKSTLALLVVLICLGSYVYFVHSYYVQPRDTGVRLGVTYYGADFASIRSALKPFALSQSRAAPFAT